MCGEEGVRREVGTQSLRTSCLCFFFVSIVLESVLYCFSPLRLGTPLVYRRCCWCCCWWCKVSGRNGCVHAPRAATGIAVELKAPSHLFEFGQRYWNRAGVVSKLYWGLALGQKAGTSKRGHGQDEEEGHAQRRGLSHHLRSHLRSHRTCASC